MTDPQPEARLDAGAAGVPAPVEPVATWFQDVPLAPFTELLDLPSGRSDHRGGPAWPDWEQQTAARHNRRGTPVDALPEPVDSGELITQPIAWAGPVESHFGHQIADFSMRIRGTLDALPGVPLTFAAHPRRGWRTLDDTPGWFREILAWLGVPEGGAQFIDRPVLAERLAVVPQAEQHKGPGPTARHLDRMDALVEERWGRAPDRSGLLYVSRAGMESRLAGEAYLETLVEASGGRVIRPESLGLDAQLRAYAGAATAVFAQGSAIHGAQLLGRSLGDVAVLNRIPGATIADWSIRPRARSLAHLDAVVGVVCGLMEDGDPFEVLGIPVLDPDRLLDLLDPVVPGLRARWEPSAYHARRDADVLGWFTSALASPRLGAPGSWDHMLVTLEACGMSHLRPTVERMMEQTREAMEPDTTATPPDDQHASLTEPVESAPVAAAEAPVAASLAAEAPPSGTGGPPPEIDPTPVPIAWWNLWKWAKLTYKAERRYYRRLGRGRKLTSKRLAASILPPISRPVFVIGAARSGTTFLGDCIGHLPEISYHHEPPATKAAGRHVYEGLWSYRRARFFFRSVYAWLLRVELDGDLRFCDKTPTNALLIPFLARAFPDAQFIHIIRDGRDASASLYKQPWLRGDAARSGKREPGGYFHGPWAPWWVEKDRVREFETTSDAHRMIWAWRRYTEAALRDGPPLGPARYHELTYEAFVTDPRGEATRILDFLGISRTSSRTAFLDAADRASEGSMGSWKRTFSAAEMAQIEADSGDLLRSLGYGD